MFIEGVGRRAVGTPTTDEAVEFVRLIRPELNGAYHLAGYLLGDATDAQDAAQDALEKAWQAWPGLRSRESVGAWFDRIVVNVCRDRLRHRHGVGLLALDELIDSTGAPDPFRQALARDEVGRLVRLLPPEQQIVVALRFWRDLTLEDIAQRTGVPLGTVKSRLHYAMASLRQELDRREKEAAR